MKALWIVIALLTLALATPAAAAQTAAPATPQAAMVTATYTLYGNATSGWGFTPGTVSEPGPAITVAMGENVSLRLLSDDGSTHNWFLALDNGNAPTAGEPSSPDFSSTTTPVIYSFIVPNKAGTFPYKCRIHPTLMTGSLTIVAAPTYVLWGSATQGWGSSAATLTTPGPALSAAQDASVEIAFYSADNATHQFFVSTDGLTTPSAGEPQSQNFSSSVVPLFYTFTVSRAGNFTYYCRYHVGVMKGAFNVTPSGGSGAPPDYTVYAVAVVVIVIVAIIAAVVIRRKPRSPPAQPPAVPPSPPQG